MHRSELRLRGHGFQRGLHVEQPAQYFELAATVDVSPHLHVLNFDPLTR